MNHLSGIPALALLTALLVAPAAAHAQSATVTDPRDPPPRADIRAATYSDKETAAVTTVHVERLRSTGTLSTRITRAGSDVGYDAIVTAGPDGHLSKRLVRVGDRSPVSCRLSASWSLPSDTIRVSVPQTCLHFAHFQSRHSFGTTLTVGSHRDAAASQVVGRGGTPGCATAAEMRRVRNGQALADVHAHLDTAGRFGDGGAGGFSRTYRACQGGKPYWVEYDGRSNRVTGKGRES